VSFRSAASGGAKVDASVSTRPQVLMTFEKRGNLEWFEKGLSRHWGCGRSFPPTR
jgi:hypothetical protein